MDGPRGPNFLCARARLAEDVSTGADPLAKRTTGGTTTAANIGPNKLVCKALRARARAGSSFARALYFDQLRNIRRDTTYLHSPIALVKVMMTGSCPVAIQWVEPHCLGIDDDLTHA
jgi:hypothetical protein